MKQVCKGKQNVKGVLISPLHDRKLSLLAFFPFYPISDGASLLYKLTCHYYLNTSSYVRCQANLPRALLVGHLPGCLSWFQHMWQCVLPRPALASSLPSGCQNSGRGRRGKPIDDCHYKSTSEP